MKSSYNNTLNYGDLLSFVCWNRTPTKIVEIGILQGYSLNIFCKNSEEECKIDAYDIFDEFNGNAANRQDIEKLFRSEKKLNIDYGDFYKLKDKYEDNSIDILHIDIANNGDVYEYVFNNYISKMKKDGIIILEGGSEERDNIEWMKKYNKSAMKNILDKYKDKYEILTVGCVPSITFIKNNK